MMKKFFRLLACSCVLMMASCSSGNADAEKAVEAARNGNIADTSQYADKAYTRFDNLDFEGKCRVATSYAWITITTGREDAAERFQECYKKTMDEDREKAQAFYESLDPQMSEGLAILSGLLDAQDNYTYGDDDKESRADSIADDIEAIGAEGVSAD